MAVNYSLFTPTHLRYEYCPMCTSLLVEAPGRDGRPRPHCRVCQWTYYPTNLLGVNVVINTPEGVVFLTQHEGIGESVVVLPGGSIEFGEAPEEAAVRLVKEETGLVVHVMGDLGKHFDRDFPLGPLLTFMFEARVIGGKLKMGHDTRIGIFPEGQFPEISPARKGSQRTLAAWIEAKKWARGLSEEVG